MCKTYRDFPDFYQNEFVQSIKDNPRWTVSDNTKKPIDMYELIYNRRIFGATTLRGHSPYLTLDELCRALPNAANNTYALDAIVDKFVVLDIEPKCPDPIKKELLKMPYLYGEISMSGKGYHLVFPLPSCIKEYPIAQTKIVMKEEHGYYEILMSHNVTFTRNVIPESEKTGDFVTLFKTMAAAQKEKVKAEIDVSAEAGHLEEIPVIDDILQLLHKQEYQRTLDDFYGDNSKYEYCRMDFLYYKLEIILKVTFIQECGHKFTDNEKAWILYTVATDDFNYRPKHDETRNGLPWLLYLAREVIAKSDKKNRKRKGEKS